MTELQLFEDLGGSLLHLQWTKEKPRTDYEFSFDGKYLKLSRQILKRGNPLIARFLLYGVAHEIKLEQNGGRLSVAPASGKG